MDPRQVRRGDVEAYVSALPATGRPPAASSINRRLSALSSWYTHLAGHGIGAGNPVDMVARPPMNRDALATRRLAPNEVRLLLEAASKQSLAGVGGLIPTTLTREPHGVTGYCSNSWLSSACKYPKQSACRSQTCSMKRMSGPSPSAARAAGSASFQCPLHCCATLSQRRTRDARPARRSGCR